MKRIICLSLILILVLGVLFSLSSCMATPNAPEGMQLVRGSDALGYYFYAPEGWVVANQGEISAAYASKIDTTSVTFVKAEAPKVTIEEYVAAELAKLPEGFNVVEPTEIKECDFGKEDYRADSAYKAIYSYTYGEYAMRCMQIYMTKGEDFYIFTFTASTAKRTEEETYYDAHLVYVDTMINEFKFVEKSGTVEAGKTEYEKVDGYYLVSDKSLCYFNFYMPEGYTVDMSTAIVSVSKGEGVYVSVSEATYGGVDDDGYWKHRFDELGLIAKDVKATGSKFTVEVKGDNNRAVGLEYSYTLFGKEYKVYQALIVVNNWRGFVFTYTAEADKYEANKAEALDMLSRLEF